MRTQTCLFQHPNPPNVFPTLYLAQIPFSTVTPPSETLHLHFTSMATCPASHSAATETEHNGLSINKCHSIDFSA